MRSRLMVEHTEVPRYYFHVEDGASFPDMKGKQLLSVASARMTAVRLSGKLLREEPDIFWLSGEAWKMIVTDADGVIIFSLHFSAVEPPLPAEIYRPKD